MLDGHRVGCKLLLISFISCILIFSSVHFAASQIEQIHGNWYVIIKQTLEIQQTSGRCQGLLPDLLTADSQLLSDVHAFYERYGTQTDDAYAWVAGQCDAPDDCPESNSRWEQNYPAPQLYFTGRTSDLWTGVSHIALGRLSGRFRDFSYNDSRVTDLICQSHNFPCDINEVRCYNEPDRRIGCLTQSIYTDYKCICRDGFMGVDCTSTLGECVSFPCQNSATCELEAQTTGGYRCECHPGFTGTHCETNIDDCAGVDCNNGVCEDQQTKFYCRCDSGWTGEYCNETNACLSSPCNYTMLCLAEGSGYRCELMDSFTTSTSTTTMTTSTSNTTNLAATTTTTPAVSGARTASGATTGVGGVATTTTSSAMTFVPMTTAPATTTTNTSSTAADDTDPTTTAVATSTSSMATDHTSTTHSTSDVISTTALTAPGNNDTGMAAAVGSADAADTTTLYIGVGVGCGVVTLVAIVVAVVVVKTRSRANRDSNNKPDYYDDAYNAKYQNASVMSSVDSATSSESDGYASLYKDDDADYAESQEKNDTGSEQNPSST